MPRVSSFLVGLAVCSSAVALEHAHRSESATDSCTDIADKVCRSEDNAKTLDRVADLAEQTRKDLDAIVKSVQGTNWKAQILARLEAEGFSLDEGQSDESVAQFFKNLYLPQTEQAGVDIFVHNASRACVSEDVSDTEVEVKLQELWSASGGPSLSIFDDTLVASHGGGENLSSSRRYREVVGPFKRSEPARSFLRSFDAWGLPGDSKQKSKDMMLAYKNYFAKEFEFVTAQRSQTIQTIANDKARILRMSRLCALMRVFQSSIGTCHEILVDPSDDGILLRAESPVFDQRVAAFEDQVLRNFEEYGEEALQALRDALDRSLFPEPLPSSFESPKALISSLLEQNAPANFNAKQALTAGLNVFGEMPLRNRLCEETARAASARLRALVNEFHDDLQLSKPYLQKVRDKIYSPQAVAQQQQQFDIAKTLVGSVVEQKLMPLVTDEAKRGLIKSSLSAVEPHVPPSANDLPFVTRPGSSTQILDLKKLDRMPGSTRNFYAMLIGTADDGIESINAYYVPELSYGVQKDPKNVFLYPGMIEAYKNRPAGLLGIWAHEIGHNFGPELSKLNGHDIRPELQKLLECLKKSHALGMADHQGDECIADWISAESMGMLLDDPAKRRLAGVPDKDYDFASQMLAPFCLFMEQGIGSPTDGFHPPARRRINGILGANPRIRAALGCADENKNYCTLEGGRAR